MKESWVNAASVSVIYLFFSTTTTPKKPGLLARASPFRNGRQSCGATPFQGHTFGDPGNCSRDGELNGLLSPTGFQVLVGGKGSHPLGMRERWEQLCEYGLHEQKLWPIVWDGLLFSGLHRSNKAVINVNLQIHHLQRIPNLSFPRVNCNWSNCWRTSINGLILAWKFSS